MSLLDKQEVQDICEHTALLARKSRYVNERQKMHTIALSGLGLLKKEKNAKLLFLTSLGAYVICAIIAMLYTHSIGNKPSNTTVVFKMRDIVPIVYSS